MCTYTYTYIYRSVGFICLELSLFHRLWGWRTPMSKSSAFHYKKADILNVERCTIHERGCNREVFENNVCYRTTGPLVAVPLSLGLQVCKQYQLGQFGGLKYMNRTYVQAGGNPRAWPAGVQDPNVGMAKGRVLQLS